MEGLIPLPQDVARDLRIGKKDCPLCLGAGNVRHEHVGADTGFCIRLSVPCVCRPHQLFHRSCSAMLPERFENADLETIMPQPRDIVNLDAALQAEIIQAVKSAPDDNYFLTGPSGTGKSYLAAAIFATRAQKWAMKVANGETKDAQACWRTRTSKLLDAHVAIALDPKASKPLVTVADIEKAVSAGHKPSLVLDEISNFKHTPFKIERLAQLVDCIYENGGQVVATANKPLDWFTAQWGVDEAESIIRRIAIGHRAHLIEFHELREQEMAA